MRFALNHMTAARKGFADFLAIASELGCDGVELRNDLSQPLFGGLDAEHAKELAAHHNLTIFAIAEVKNFNIPASLNIDTLDALIEQASNSGAKAVSLIPGNNGEFQHDDAAKDALATTLQTLKPRLDSAGLQGLIEPLGFASSTIRLKSTVVELLDRIGGNDTFKLIHDTFHHTLASESAVYPDHTAIVHVSGVTDTAIGVANMLDSHRVLVDASDRLGNIKQLSQLVSAGYTGPVSFEAFASDVHALDMPAQELGRSMAFIRSSVNATI